MRRSRWGALLVLLLTACASPRPHLYVLDTPTDADDRVPEQRASVLVGPVTVPQEVDRPQIVIREGALGVVVAEDQRWAAPLKDMLPRVLAAELSRRSSRRFVPFSSAALASPARLAVDVLRFEVSRAGGATVVAHWVYRAPTSGTPPVEGDAKGQAVVSGVGFEPMVDALRRASVMLAAHIAGQLPADR